MPTSTSPGQGLDPAAATRRPILRLISAVVALLATAADAAEWPLPDNPAIEIPAGSFVRGSDDGEANEAPAERITLPAFRIAKFEVTNRLYRAFVAAAGHRPAFYDSHPVLGLDDHPVVGVSWGDADAFCRHHGLRLPTEAEWERAARGTDGRRFAWGDTPATADRVSRGAAQCCGPDAADGYGATAPVGSFPAGNTPAGVADLTGNVWEWVDGWYNPYDARPAAQVQEFRVLRGGGWNSDDWKLRAAYRLAYDGAFRFAANGGFRCVSSP